MPGLLRYYFFWIFGGVVVFIVMFLHARSHFSMQKLDYLVETRSNKRVITEDPCRFRLTGNPTQPDQYQVRVNFFCKDGRISWNTLAFTSLKDQTAGGAIGEVARIHGFSSEIIRPWRCDISGKVVEDWKISIYQGNWIECHEG